MSAHPLLSNDNDLLFAQNVQPKATPGVAQDSAPPPSGGPPGGSPIAGLMPLLMMLVVLLPFFFLMSRRTKKEAQARAALKKGDRVMSSGGILGDLVDMDDRIAKVKIAPGITVQILASNVSPFVESTQKAAAAAPAKELKEAKAGSDKK